MEGRAKVGGQEKRTVDVYLNSHRVGLFTASGGGGGINSDSFRVATGRQGLLEGAFVAREENDLIKGGVCASVWANKLASV